jgi:hypothetical protein
LHKGNLDWNVDCSVKQQNDNEEIPPLLVFVGGKYDPFGVKLPLDKLSFNLHCILLLAVSIIPIVLHILSFVEPIVEKVFVGEELQAKNHHGTSGSPQGQFPQKPQSLLLIFR